MVQWLGRRTWDRKVESSSPGRCTHVVGLRQNAQLSQCLSPAKCFVAGDQQIVLGQLDKMLGGNLRWTSIPSRRNYSKTLHTTDKRRADGPLAHPISLGADFAYFTIPKRFYSPQPTRLLSQRDKEQMQACYVVPGAYQRIATNLLYKVMYP